MSTDLTDTLATPKPGAVRAGAVSRVLSLLLVASLFVTHWRVEIAGLHFLPEHFLTVALVVSLLLNGRAADMVRIARDRTCLLLVAYIGWEAVISVLQAPDLRVSLGVVGWLGLDWLLLIAIVASIGSAVRIERLGVSFSAIAAAVAMGVGIATLVSSTTIGTQEVGLHQGLAVFGLSYEANILASASAVWAFVAVSSSDTWVLRVARVAVPLAIAAIAFSMTRAVVLGLALGLLIWAVTSGERARRAVLRIGAGVLVAAAVVVVALPGVAAPFERRAGDLLQVRGGTGQKRVDEVKTGLADMSPGSYVYGLGLDSYGQRHEEPTLVGVRGYLSVLPVQVLYDGGAVALVLLGLALGSLRPLARPGRGRALALLAIYASAAVATSPFWFGWTWLLIALAMMTRPPWPSGRGRLVGAG